MKKLDTNGNLVSLDFNASKNFRAIFRIVCHFDQFVYIVKNFESDYAQNEREHFI